MRLCVSVSTSVSGDMSALTTATQSFNSSVDVPTTAAFITQGRRRGDGQDVDNTTNSSDTQYVLVLYSSAGNISRTQYPPLTDGR